VSTKHFAGLLLLLSTLGVLSACAGLKAFQDPVKAGPFYAPKNFSGDPVMPAGIRRVVLLPVHTEGIATPETAASIDLALVSALQRQARFEVVVLTREESVRWFGAAEFASTEALPPGYLPKLAAKFAADAVLFVDLTVYAPYRPMVIGFRAKLATVQEVRLVWTFDEVVSAGDPTVANRARHEFLQTDRGSQPVDLSPTVLQNPSRFANFVAGAMFQTLPSR